MRRSDFLALAIALVGCERNPAPESVTAMPVSSPDPTHREPVGPQPLVVPADATAATPRIVTASEVFAHPDWIGTTVTVDIREALLDDRHSSGAPPGGYDVAVKDVLANRFHVTPAATAADGMTKLGTLAAPIRVTGKLTGSSTNLDLTPTSITPLTFEAPLKLASAAEILTNPAVHSGMVIEATDTWVTGFEASIFGRTAWVGAYGNVKRICEPTWPTTTGPPESRSARVRMIGLVYNKPKYGYGHMSMMSAELIATEIEWLAPRDPKCY